MAEGEGSISAPRINTDEGRAAVRLFAALYEDLHRVARRELRRHVGVSLSPTTLVHETFLSSSVRGFAEMSDRGRFMVYASRAMRGLIIDYLRRKNAVKRGREIDFVSLPDELQAAMQSDISVEQLQEALDALAGIDARLAQCVDLKFFCGYSFADIARLWDVSERTVQRDWDKARLLLNDLIMGLRSCTDL